MTRLIPTISTVANLSFSRLGRVLVATAAVSALVSAPSFAQSLVTFSLVSIAGTQTIGVTTDNGASYYNRAVGRYQATIDSTNYIVFCIDILHPAQLNKPFTADVSQNLTNPTGPLVGNYYNGGLASALTPADYLVNTTPAQAAQRSSQVAWLADNFLDANASAFTNGLAGSYSYGDNLAAISLSIWDISQDGGDGVGTGGLRVDSASQVRLGSLVDYYQNQARQNSNYVSSTAKWVQAPRTNGAGGGHGQDFTYKPVPEAGTLALVGLMMPAIPFAVRRMRRSK